MAIQAKDYLGVWIDTYADDTTGANIECTSVDVPKMMAYFSDGRQVSIVELDTSGRYQKPQPWYQNDKVAGELNSMGYDKSRSLASQAPQSDVLGDLSKIGHRKPERSGYAHVENLHERADGTVGVGETCPSISTSATSLSDNPVTNFIDSAIQISRKTGAKTTLPVTVELTIDFDIINVIKMSMQIGASDVEILQHIMKYISVPEDYVKALIARELMSPADAEIVNENREDKFDDVLAEELAKHDEPADEEFQDL